nr:MAG TPA: hypothetical protein [Bacteriophage sp.]
MSDRGFIYVILVSYGSPFIPTVLTLELFAGLSACLAPYCYINQLCIF